MSRVESVVSVRSVKFPTNEFLALFLPIAVLVFVMCFSFANLQLEKRIQQLKDEDSSRLHSISGFIGAEVLGSLNQLLSIATEPAIIAALEAYDSNQVKTIEYSFLTLARQNPQYQQIRWIDESGLEKVRIMRDSGDPFIVSQHDLQDKSQRYYFKEANALLSGEIYISKVDLNIEHGKIEYPPRPMLRIATPLQDVNRKHRGIIIINIEMQYLFNLVRNKSEDELQTSYLLINQQGELLNTWVEGSQTKEISEKTDDFIGKQPEIWQKITKNDTGNVEMKDGLWTWKTLSPVSTFKQLMQAFSVQSKVFENLITDEFSLTLVANRSLKTLVEMRSDSRFLTTLVTLLGLTVYGVSLFFYLNGHARARRAELNAAYALARASNVERQKELEERFHRLVEASSIGQLVVDSSGNIELSNSAADSMLGYETGELEGLSVDVLIPKDLQAQHTQMRDTYSRKPDARKMGDGRELMAVMKDGAKIPVEIGLNPYSDQGRQLVLVSIIGLSIGKHA